MGRKASKNLTMASTASLRSRRSAAQLHALVGVEREIKANDPNSRRKYLQDFGQAFRSYESVLDSSKVERSVCEADIVLIGDYHALPAAQHFAGSLLAQRAKAGDRPVVLGVETVFSRDQHILEEWLRHEIEEDELRERVRFDLDWGYEWAPFYELLETAREHNTPVYGLDCMPRGDLRRAPIHDRHAAEKIAEVGAQHPDAVIVVLFGESHLAPTHLPQLLRAGLKNKRLLTVLQNVDALYWQAAGEQDHVKAVRVADDVICVFNSTPLEKYESYRLCLDRWGEKDADSPDLAPTVYNLIDGLLRFLGINRYASHNGTQPKFLVDLLPEVHCHPSDEQLCRLLWRKGRAEDEKEAVLQRLEERGSAYVARLNTLYVREFRMAYTAEEVARFLHHACRGLPLRTNGHTSDPISAEDLFYARALENALAYLGSRVMYPPRPPLREADLYELYEQTCEDVEQQSSFTLGEFMKMADFMILHREFELNPQRFPETPKPIEEGVQSTGEKFDYATQQLGYLLGSDLYDAYLEGRVTRGVLRRLFLTRLEQPGAARDMYFSLVRKVRAGRKRERGEAGK